MRYAPLLFILLLGATLRFALLGSNAPPLYSDEIEQYVSIHNIVTTGVDVDGTLQPFIYSRLQRHPPIYGITAYLASLVLGKNPLAMRFPAAAFGVVSIWFTYLIVLELTRRRKIALLAALLTAIEPIQIHFSRIGWEPASTLPFLLGGLWLLLSALRDAPRSVSFPRLAAAAVVLGLCPYTYDAAWLYAAILTGGLVAVNFRALRLPSNRRKLLAATAIGLAMATPGLLMASTDPSTAYRASRIATFAYGISGDSLRIFFSHYWANFGWPYLFATGVSDSRYLSGYGTLFWWYGPLIVVGMIYAHRYTRSRALNVWIWLWLLVYPLGAALTNDGLTTHPPRTIAGSPILAIFAAIGGYALYHLVGLFDSRAVRERFRLGLMALLAVCLVSSVWSFAAYYYRVYPISSASAWNSGAGAGFEAVRALQDRFKRVCLVGFNYYQVGGLEGYYLQNTPLKISEVGGPPCANPLTLVLTTQPGEVPGFTTIRTFKALDGKVFATLKVRDPIESRRAGAKG
jgi:hypothetical protein